RPLSAHCPSTILSKLEPVVGFAPYYCCVPNCTSSMQINRLRSFPSENTVSCQSERFKKYPATSGSKFFHHSTTIILLELLLEVSTRCSSNTACNTIRAILARPALARSGTLAFSVRGGTDFILVAVRFGHQRQDRFHTHSHVVRDDARLVDQVGHRRGKHGVGAGDFPLLLQHDRERQSMFLHLCPILLRFAPADHNQFERGRRSALSSERRRTCVPAM